MESDVGESARDRKGLGDAVAFNGHSGVVAGGVDLRGGVPEAGSICVTEV